MGVGHKETGSVDCRKEEEQVPKPGQRPRGGAQASLGLAKARRGLLPRWEGIGVGFVSSRVRDWPSCEVNHPLSLLGDGSGEPGGC